MWLLGPPGWRRLDIILPEHRWTLAAHESAEGTAEGDALLNKWLKLLEDVAPEKPVSEIRNGWMEKKGGFMSGWKKRWFVATNKADNFAIVYFASEEDARDPKKKKGMIQPCGLRVKRLEMERKLKEMESKLVRGVDDLEAETDKEVNKILAEIAGETAVHTGCSVSTASSC